MRITLLFIFLLITSSGFCQTTEAKYPNFSGETLSKVLKSKDWEILKKAEGDLNSDSQKDLALVIQSKDSLLEKRCESCEKLKSKARIILVFISKQGKPTVISQNNKFIARADEGDRLQHLEPQISIKGNQLFVFYEFVEGTAKYSFKYQNHEMFLVNAKTVNVSGSIISTYCFDFIKKVITSKEEKIGIDSTNVETTSIKLDGLKKLSELGIRKSWEVAQYIYL